MVDPDAYLDNDSGRDAGGLINPAQFPCKSSDLDVEAIRASAEALSAMGGAVKEKVDDIGFEWDKLPPSYRAPEQDQVYALMDPAETAAEAVRSDLQTAAFSIGVYALTLENLKQRLVDLETDAWVFRNDVIDGVWVSYQEATGDYSAEASYGVAIAESSGRSTDELIPWNEHTASIQRNEELLAEHAAIVEEISQAAAQCGNAILNRVDGGACVMPYEAIPASALMDPDGDFPWGSAVPEDRNCNEQVGDGIVNFGVGTFQGVAAFAGFDFTDGVSWSLENSGQAIVGTLDFAAGTLLLAGGPVTAAYVASRGPDMIENPNWIDQRMLNAATGWSSMIGYDLQEEMAGGNGWHRWEDSPGTAITESVLNIGTMFIPVGGAAAAVARVGGLGARIARLSSGVDFEIPASRWLVGGNGIRLTDIVQNAFRLDDSLFDRGSGGGLTPHERMSQLIDRVDDAPTQPHTPVSDGAFAGRPPGGDGPGAPGVAAHVGDGSAPSGAGAGGGGGTPAGTGAGAAHGAGDGDGDAPAGGSAGNGNNGSSAADDDAPNPDVDAAEDAGAAPRDDSADVDVDGAHSGDARPGDAPGSLTDRPAATGPVPSNGPSGSDGDAPTAPDADAPAAADGDAPTALDADASPEGDPATPTSTPGVGDPPTWTPMSADDIAGLDVVRDGSHINAEGKLTPNTWYSTGDHNYVYHTDADGYIDRWVAEDLQLTERPDRLDHEANTPGKLPEDHAGHLAGDRFGGSPRLDNIVSQLANHNLSAYKRMENLWARALNGTPPAPVSVEVRLVNGPTGRPSRFEIVSFIGTKRHLLTLTQ